MRDGLGSGLDTGDGMGLGAGLRSLPPAPRLGSTDSRCPLPPAGVRSCVSHVNEILREGRLARRPRLSGTATAPSTVSRSSAGARSLRTQYSASSRDRRRYCSLSDASWGWWNAMGCLINSFMDSFSLKLYLKSFAYHLKNPEKSLFLPDCRMNSGVSRRANLLVISLQHFAGPKKAITNKPICVYRGC